MMLVERTIIAKLVSELDAAGFVPVKFYDGEDYQHIANPMDNAADAKDRLACVTAAVSSVDEGTLHFAPKTDLTEWGRRGVLLILGNGEDIISDYHTATSTPAFGQAIDRVAEWINNGGV